MKVSRKDLQGVEMQMGPMIDMVFLLLVFFMVTAKPVKQESDIGIGLPGTVAQEEVLDIPDEQKIVIHADGRVELNEMEMGAAGVREMPLLKKTLVRYKESCDANREDALVTVDAGDGAKHQRIVDVLNVVGQAGISGVSFAGAEEEEF